MHRAWRSSLFLIACACSDDASPAAPQPLIAVPGDAAIDGTRMAATAQPDEQPFATTTRQKGPGRPIEIILRSTPSGAKVSVDGVEIGTTPTIWLGETGAAHEFTFVLERHALARYRFVPVASGLVHPRLEPVADERDAQRPPREMIAPHPAPPPTVVAPEPPLSAPPPDAAELATPPVIDAAPPAL